MGNIFYSIRFAFFVTVYLYQNMQEVYDPNPYFFGLFIFDIQKINRTIYWQLNQQKMDLDLYKWFGTVPSDIGSIFTSLLYRDTMFIINIWYSLNRTKMGFLFSLDYTSNMIYQGKHLCLFHLIPKIIFATYKNTLNQKTKKK